MPRTVRELAACVSGVDIALVNADTGLSDELGLDSLELLGLLSTIESEYNLSDTPSEIISTFQTVGDVEEYVRSTVAKCRPNNS